MLQRNALLPFVIYCTSLLLNKVAASSSDDFTYGDQGSNSCPESYYPITSSWACQAAMSMANSALTDGLDGENFQGDENIAYFPKGCYSCSENTNTCTKGFWFNEHIEGTGESSARLFCAKPNVVNELNKDNFTYGDQGSNSCPVSYSPITSSLWACRAAMSMADSAFKDDLDGENFQDYENSAFFPKGCYSCSKNTKTCKKGFWFNDHTEGTGESSARLFCAKPNVVNDSTEVAFIGDSDIDYWYTTELVIPGSYNYGVGGYTCKNVIAEIDNLIDTVSPNVIVLVCGENDLADKKSVDKTFKNFKEIVDKAKSRDIQVIYLGTKPEPRTRSIHEKYRMYDTKIKELAVTLFDEVANNPTPLTVIDVYSVFDAHENKNDLYDSDKLHLSKDGYDLWNTWLQIAYKEIYPGKINSCPVWKNGLCFNKSDDNKSYEIDCNACKEKKCKKTCEKIKKKSDKQKDKYCEKHSNKGTSKSFCVEL